MMETAQASIIVFETGKKNKQKNFNISFLHLFHCFTQVHNEFSFHLIISRKSRFSSEFIIRDGFRAEEEFGEKRSLKEPSARSDWRQSNVIVPLLGDG